jgi:GTP-binding protein YchF
MQIGIIGLPNSGKTTIFNALTDSTTATSAVSTGKLETHVATVSVPDPRVARLSEMFRPQKTTYAQIQFNDVAGLQRGISSNGGLNGAFLTQLSQNDALVHVVRAFEDDAVPHSEGNIDPRRDIEVLDTELILSDLSIIERRMERLDASLRKSKNGERDAYLAERALLTRLTSALEQEVPVRDTGLTPREEKVIRGFQLMTAKPTLLILNGGDNGNDRSTEVEPVNNQKTAAIVLKGRLEAEIAQLDPEDARAFMAEYDIEEPGLNRAIRLAYELLGLMSFFTVGDDEVRAWTVHRGANAVEAAAAIHTDLARGFIRAEVVSYDDFSASGSLAAARQRGLLRLEGRDYIVQDGDILNIRFNV